MTLIPDDCEIQALISYFRIRKRHKKLLSSSQFTKQTGTYFLCVVARDGTVSIDVCAKKLASVSQFFARNFKIFATGSMLLPLPLFEVATVRACVDILLLWRWPIWCCRDDRGALFEILSTKSTKELLGMCRCLRYFQAPKQLVKLITMLYSLSSPTINKTLNQLAKLIKKKRHLV